MLGKLEPGRSSLIFAGLALTTLVFIYSVYSQSGPQVGYAVITPDEDSSTPIVAALFSFRNPEGILVAEAGAEAVEPIRRGRIFVDASIPTGLALANHSGEDVTATLTLRDALGLEEASTELTIPAFEQRARFVSEAELFGPLPQGFIGSLTFVTNGPGLAALTIRQSTNVHGEPLFATLPVADLDRESAQPGSTVEDDRPGQQGRVPSLIFPHLGAGGILSTQIILINPESEALGGEIRLTGSDGLPLELELDGQVNSRFSYELAPHGVFQGTLTSSAGVLAGYAVVTVEEGAGIPSGTAIFQFRDATGALESEAGVGAVLPTTRARIFVDTVDTRTGVAIASPGNGPAAVRFRLSDRNGLAFAEATRDLMADGHLPIFADELFEDLPPGFTGALEIETEVPIVPVSLKLTLNRRGDFILTTLPVADLSRPIQSRTLVLPQIGFGFGFSTRLILISVQETNAITGLLTLTQSDGAPLSIPLLGVTDNEFNYHVFASGAGQLRPGNTAEAAEIVLNPSDPLATEVVVNRGNELILRALVVDTSGELRDDFPIAYTSLDEQVATIDERGRLAAREAGFSTLTVQSGARLKTRTITVVEVTAGAEGLAIAGLAQDLAGRLYLAASDAETILLAESVNAEPQVYAGRENTPGLRNGERLDALFDGPAFLTLNQASGDLYVSDAENGVIRTVEPGPRGRVETLDQTRGAFLEPRGVALDGRGRLWVADAGSHTIRRIDLLSGAVTTIAGRQGEPGFVDGVGEEARFNRPMGLTLEAEPLAQQLERELRGDPSPPVRILVADFGNGSIRRVDENGQVQTLTTPQSGAVELEARQGRSLRSFLDPVSVRVDSSGNIYVAQRDEVLTLLTDGTVAPAAERGTVDRPQDLSTARVGEVVVSDSGGGRLLRYGRPQITGLMPAETDSRGGETITILGRNFAPETQVFISGRQVENVIRENTARIHFVSPPLLSGLSTVTVRNRAGLAQGSFLIAPPRLADVPAGHITTVAGGSTFIGDGNPAVSASLARPSAITLDANGNLFVADYFHFVVRRIDLTSGLINTVAGGGISATGGDNGPALAAFLGSVEDLAVDPAGNLFLLTDQVRRVDARTGIITTLPGYRRAAGSNGNLAIDNDGNLFVGEGGDCCIRREDGTILPVPGKVTRINLQTGLADAFAGGGAPPDGVGDDGPATEADLYPRALALDRNGNLYIADGLNDRIRKVDKEGTITTVPGGEGPFPGQAVSDLAIDSQNRLLIASAGGSLIQLLDQETGNLETVAGSGCKGFGQPGDGGPAVDACFSARGIVVDAAGNLYVADSLYNRVRRISGVSDRVSTVAGPGELNYEATPAVAAMFNVVSDIAADALGNIYLSQLKALPFPPAGVLQVDPGGLIGQLLEEFEARALAVDETGNLLLGERGQVSRLDLRSMERTVVAGTGIEGSSGDGGPATQAQIELSDLAVAANGDVFIAEFGRHRVRRVSASTGIIDTFAGTGEQGFSGDGGDARDANLDPFSLAVDRDRLFIVVDRRVREVNLTTGVINTVAGSWPDCDPGDGGPAIEACLEPYGLVADGNGNLFVSDNGSKPRVRKIDLQTGIISTIAGPGEESDVISGDGGVATEADLLFTGRLAVDAQGNLLMVAPLRIRAVRGPFR